MTTLTGRETAAQTVRIVSRSASIRVRSRGSDLATLIMWLAAGAGFGRYLAEYSFTYVNTYAGLASAMIALVFLYWTASIFVYGCELNAARLRFDLQAKQTEAV